MNGRSAGQLLLLISCGGPLRRTSGRSVALPSPSSPCPCQNTISGRGFPAASDAASGAAAAAQWTTSKPRTTTAMALEWLVRGPSRTTSRAPAHASAELECRADRDSIDAVMALLAKFFEWIEPANPFLDS